MVTKHVLYPISKDHPPGRTRIAIWTYIPKNGVGSLPEPGRASLGAHRPPHTDLGPTMQAGQRNRPTSVRVSASARRPWLEPVETVPWKQGPQKLGQPRQLNRLS